MRRALLVLLLAATVAGCGDDTDERNGKLQKEAERKATLLSDCRLVIPALSRAQTEHRRAAQREDFDRTGFEIQAFTKRARLLGCPVVSSE